MIQSSFILVKLKAKLAFRFIDGFPRLILIIIVLIVLESSDFVSVMSYLLQSRKSSLLLTSTKVIVNRIQRTSWTQRLFFSKVKNIRRRSMGITGQISYQTSSLHHALLKR